MACLENLSSKRIFIDLETEGIDITSPHPPKPIGIAYKYECEEAHYMSFGHVSGNNATWGEARAFLENVYQSELVMCFHNACFDLFVIEYHFGLRVPDVSRFDDTMLLAFIVDPEFPTFRLKELSDLLLDMPPTEQDHLLQRLKDKNPTVKSSELMRHVATLPSDVVAPYAKGDVERTEQLYKYLYRCLDARYRIEHYDECAPDERLLTAYEREKRAAVIFARMRYAGVRVDVTKLSVDIDTVKTILSEIDGYFFNLLGEQINFNSSAQVLAAFNRLNLLDNTKLAITKKGNCSASSDSLSEALTDKEVASVYKYRQSLRTLSRTFMQNWLDVASKNNGLIFTDWFSIGARTGRVTSRPNFQNLPRVFEIDKLFNIDNKNPDLPAFPLKNVKPFSPQIREYIIPYEQSHKLISCDYSQQELRLLAHYENQTLLAEYKNNPLTDLHMFVANTMSSSAKTIDKSTAKMINFSIIYGSGVKNLAEKLNLTEDIVSRLLVKHRDIFPNIHKVRATLTQRANKGLPFYTLGGRRYFAQIDEDSANIKAHKLVNTLIQAGSADMTKQAMIDYYAVKSPEAVLILSTHDEISLSVPLEILDSEKTKLLNAMESQKCRTPLIAVANVGDTLAECK